MHSSEDNLRDEARVRTTRENVEDNSRSVCAPSSRSLSSWHIVSLCPANAVDSAFIFCFFLPDDYLKSVGTHKLFSFFFFFGQGFIEYIKFLKKTCFIYCGNPKKYYHSPSEWIWEGVFYPSPIAWTSTSDATFQGIQSVYFWQESSLRGN